MSSGMRDHTLALKFDVDFQWNASSKGLARQLCWGTIAKLRYTHKWLTNARNSGTRRVTGRAKLSHVDIDPACRDYRVAFSENLIRYGVW